MIRRPADTAIGDDLSIGERVAYWRKRRGRSQRVLAGLAGLSQPYLSQIETGTRSVERRATLVALASALQVTVAELTGEPGDPTDPARAAAAAHLPAIREALIMREAGERGSPSGHHVTSLTDALARYDFAEAATLLPGLLRGSSNGSLMQSAALAAFTLKHLGQMDLAREAARLCVTTARDLDDRAWIGVGEAVRIHSMPTESAIAPTLAERAADEAQPYIGDSRVRRAYGMLHLQAAVRSAAAHRADDALAHLREAQESAESMGEPDDWTGLALSCFGPTNVSMHRVTVHVELGDQGRAREIASAVAPERIPFRHRQSSFYVGYGNLLASNSRRDREAISAFLRAEALAPQYVRINALARDTVAVIVRRTQRNAVDVSLRRAAEAVGLASLLAR